jgi:hypothetical protein
MGEGKGWAFLGGTLGFIPILRVEKILGFRVQVSQIWPEKRKSLIHPDCPLTHTPIEWKCGQNVQPTAFSTCLFLGMWLLELDSRKPRRIWASVENYLILFPSLLDLAPGHFWTKLPTTRYIP